MAYTSRQLIIDAYYLSGIVSRNLETVPGDEINDGLNRLNGFLTIKGAKTKLIPYYTKFDGMLLQGQEVYSIDNLIEIDTMTFFLQNPNNDPSSPSVRFPLWEQSRYNYFDRARAERLTAIPITYHMERRKNGSDIYIYPLPNQDYVYQIVGKYALLSTTLNQDLSTVYDSWYLEYIKYGLALYLCEWRSVVPPASVALTFKEITDEMTTLSPMDFTLRKSSYFKSSGGLTWGNVTFHSVWGTGG